MCQSKEISEESWSSSSPPPAPAPAQSVPNFPPNEPGSQLSDMLHQYDELTRQQEELERKRKEIKENIDTYVSNVSKYCVIDIAINNIMCDQSIMIKLFDTLAPVACDLFRGCCGNKYNYNYEGSTLDYIMKNKFITGGNVSIFNSDGSKFINKIKEKHLNHILHDRAGLVTMNPSESLTRFTITLGPVENFNGNYIVFGEIVAGMEILQSINDRYADVQADADGGIQLKNIDIYSCAEK